MTLRQRAQNWICLRRAGFCFTSAGWRRKKIPVCSSVPLPSLNGNGPGDFHLLVIGDGPERGDLAELQARARMSLGCGIARISADLARYYRAADLFVHPGIQETFGLVALESQACGTPVVGIRGSYMDRIILHDQESWAEEETPESLARTIEAACSRNLPTTGERALRAWRGTSFLAPGVRTFILHLSGSLL